MVVAGVTVLQEDVVVGMRVDGDEVVEGGDTD